MDAVARRNLEAKAKNIRLGRRVKSHPETEATIENYLKAKPSFGPIFALNGGRIR